MTSMMLDPILLTGWTVTFLADAWQTLESGSLLQFLSCIAVLGGIALLIKKLFWDKGHAVSPQPLIVALEKEFLLKRDHDKYREEQESVNTGVHRELKEVRAYIHTEVHGMRGELQALVLAGKHRDDLLSAVDERTKIQSRSIDNLGLKVDRIVDRVSDKVEALLKHRERPAS